MFLEKPCTAAELIKAVNALVMPARSEFDDFDARTWDPATLAILRQALSDACAMYQPELGRQRDERKVALRNAARAVADLALTGVRDGERLTNYARLAIQSSITSEDAAIRQPLD